jgi:acyl-CoA thioester hydrolase
MSRTKLELPASMPFATEIPVRITDINYGGHLGNDSLLALLHEARVRFLASHGWTEINIEGAAIIMVDAVIAYKGEVFYGDTLRVEIGVGNVGRGSCDIYYRVTKTNTGAPVADAKTGISFFNYQTRKIMRTPAGFAQKFGAPT